MAASSEAIIVITAEEIQKLIAITKKIVISIDMDGALLSSGLATIAMRKIRERWQREGLTQEPTWLDWKLCDVEEALEEAHADLIARIVASTPKDAIIRLFSGSNRQTRKRNFCSGYDNSNGCSAMALHAFERILKKHELNVVRDDLLLEDLTQNQPHGFHFSDMLTNGVNAGNTVEAEDVDRRVEFDEGKILLLYTQIHKSAMVSAAVTTADVATSDAAITHPKEYTIVNFYDDDANNEIFKALKTFYTDNSTTIPDNIILQLHQYEGPKAEKTGRPAAEATYRQVTAIKGSGKINAAYEDTFRAAATCVDTDKRRPSLLIEKFINVINMTARTPEAKAREVEEARQMASTKSVETPPTKSRGSGITRTASGFFGNIKRTLSPKPKGGTLPKSSSARGSSALSGPSTSHK